MIAAQLIKDNPELVIYSITSNGTLWLFGKLEGKTFTKNPRPTEIYELDALFATVNYIFEQCEYQLEVLATT